MIGKHTGKIHGDICVGEIVGKKGKTSLYACTCVCGHTYTTEYWCVSSSVTGRCRKCYKTVHDMARHALYPTWRNMLARCYDTANPAYQGYGGRGIKVCERWHDISAFIADIGQRPDGHTLDRIDNNGDYCPENCRWATRKEQARNRRSNTRIMLNGVTHSITEWSEILGINYGTVKSRIRAGYSVEDALTLPVRGYKK